MEDKVEKTPKQSSSKEKDSFQKSKRRKKNCTDSLGCEPFSAGRRFPGQGGEAGQPRGRQEDVARPRGESNRPDTGKAWEGRDRKNKAVEEQMLTGIHTREERPWEKQKQNKATLKAARKKRSKTKGKRRAEKVWRAHTAQRLQHTPTGIPGEGT